MGKSTAEHITSHIKGLAKHLHPDEQPILTIPAIWDNATQQESKACDIVLTNQRLFGFVYVTFPRERLFLDALALNQITAVTLRDKNLSPLQEMLVSDGRQKIYIRAPGKKIKQLSSGLQAAISEHAPDAPVSRSVSSASNTTSTESRTTPVFDRQIVKQTLERSPMGIAAVLIGGIFLQIVGVILALATHNLQTGLPLFLAGLLAVVLATIARRQMR